jgi:hypothetical protein
LNPSVCGIIGGFVMHSSLAWIEWLDRLDRVLSAARQDVVAVARSSSARALAATERSKRQLSALTDELRLLDSNVLAADPGTTSPDLAQNLQTALDTAVFHLGTVSEVTAAKSPSVRERALAAIDSALRDSSQEAAMLLDPRRRHAWTQGADGSEFR